MTEGDALRHAVVADPDDDTPRLIYADWLDENGQPDRAAFIRAQVESARAEPFSPRSRTANDLANRILESHRVGWTQHLNSHCVEPPRFHRGFVEHVAVEPISIVSALEAILDTEPVRSLRVIRTDYEGGWISLMPVFEAPRLRQIRQIELTSPGGFIHEEYTALIESPNLASVKRLSLRGNPIQPSWLEEMLNSAAFPELTGLDIAENTNLGPGLLNALNRASHRELRHLDASGVVFTSSELQKVLASRCLEHIEELRLGFAGRGEPGPLFHLDIGWVIPWKQLLILELGGQRLGDDAVWAITSQDEACGLRWLGLSKNELSSEAVRLLIKSKYLKLNYLDVRGNGFSPNEIAALQARFPDALVVR
jgi:uncharacterized protein (TIGR02996 family)